MNSKKSCARRRIALTLSWLIPKVTCSDIEIKRSPGAALYGAFSADASPGVAQRFREAAAAAYLPKPIERDTLLSVIRVVLSQEDHARDFVTQHKARELLLRSKRVLFVSTKPDNYQGLSLSLQQVGVELNFVKPAEAAAEHVADGNYDIVAIETAILGAHLSGLFQLTRGQRPSPLFVGVGSARPCSSKWMHGGTMIQNVTCF